MFWEAHRTIPATHTRRIKTALPVPCTRFFSIRTHQGSAYPLQRIGLSPGPCITNGYAVTQRNKIHSLGIESLLDLIVISKNLDLKNRQKIIIQFFTALDRINIIISAIIPTKILSLPNKLGWTTICLLIRACNIHWQQFSLAPEYLPQLTIPAITDLAGILQLASFLVCREQQPSFTFSLQVLIY